MSYNTVDDDRIFARRYAEMKEFSSNLDRYQKANKKALLALHEVRAALSKLTLCVSEMAKGPEVASDVQNVLNSAHNDVENVKQSSSFLELSAVLSEQVKRYATSLDQSADKLHAMGKERKAAKEEVLKYSKKRQKDDKYQFKLQESYQVLAAKEHNYGAYFDNVTRQREDYVPLILQTTLKATHKYLSDLTSTVGTVKDCVTMFVDAHMRNYSVGGSTPGGGAGIASSSYRSPSAGPLTDNTSCRSQSMGHQAEARPAVYSSQEMRGTGGQPPVAPAAASSQAPMVAVPSSMRTLYDSSAIPNGAQPSIPVSEQPPPLYQYPPTVSTVRPDHDSSLTGTRVQGIPLSDDAAYTRMPEARENSPYGNPASYINSGGKGI